MSAADSISIEKALTNAGFEINPDLASAQSMWPDKPEDTNPYGYNEGYLFFGEVDISNYSGNISIENQANYSDVGMVVIGRAGIILLLEKEQAIAIWGIVWAVFSLQDAAAEINDYYRTKEFRAVGAITIVLTIVFSALLMLDPFEHFAFHIRILGLEMIAETFIRRRDSRNIYLLEDGSNMIRNIVFDISNVLAPFRFKEFLAEKGFDTAMIKRIIRASAMTPYWTEYEKGKLTYEEAIEAFLSVDPDIREELHRAYDSCSGIMGRYDYTEEWIDALKGAGYKLFCITNFTPAGYEQCYNCISFIERFDGCVFSFREGIAKPDPEIYKTLLRRYDLKAEECVFIDDTEENVHSAEELGFAGIVFTGYEDAVKKLDKVISLKK